MQVSIWVTYQASGHFDSQYSPFTHFNSTYVLFFEQKSVYKEDSGIKTIIECGNLCVLEKSKCIAYATKVNSDQKTYNCQMITQNSLPTYADDELSIVSLFEKKDAFIFS